MFVGAPGLTDLSGSMNLGVPTGGTPSGLRTGAGALTRIHPVQVHLATRQGEERSRRREPPAP